MTDFGINLFFFLIDIELYVQLIYKVWITKFFFQMIFHCDVLDNKVKKKNLLSHGKFAIHEQMTKREQSYSKYITVKVQRFI